MVNRLVLLRLTCTALLALAHRQGVQYPSTEVSLVLERVAYHPLRLAFVAPKRGLG